MHQYYEDLYELIAAAQGPKSSWYIVTDVGSDTYYLKGVEVKTQIARWVQHHDDAQTFATEKAAKEYVKTFLGKRQVVVVEHEVE